LFAIFRLLSVVEAPEPNAAEAPNFEFLKIHFFSELAARAIFVNKNF
jgi:hypothetical protein